MGAPAHVLRIVCHQAARLVFRFLAEALRDFGFALFVVEDDDCSAAARSPRAAQNNARLMGRRGVQFAWESAPSTGDEAAPLPGTAAWHEDHVSLDVARAFAFHADVSGEAEFLRQKAWPVLSGVAEWITTRTAKTRRGYEVRASMGIAERKQTVKNAAFTNMASVVVLRDAIAAAERLGRQADPAWARIADAMVVPRRGKAIVSHDDYRRDEEKGATPDPLMGRLAVWFPPGRERGTGHAEVLPRPGRQLCRKPDAFRAVRGLGGPHRQPTAGAKNAG